MLKPSIAIESKSKAYVMSLPHVAEFGGGTVFTRTREERDTS